MREMRARCKAPLPQRGVDKARAPSVKAILWKWKSAHKTAARALLCCASTAVLRRCCPCCPVRLPSHSRSSSLESPREGSNHCNESRPCRGGRPFAQGGRGGGGGGGSAAMVWRECGDGVAGSSITGLLRRCSCCRRGYPSLRTTPARRPGSPSPLPTRRVLPSPRRPPPARRTWLQSTNLR